MKRILYFDWFQDATSFYRLAPLSYLQIEGITIDKSSDFNISWSTLLNYDAIIIERPSTKESLNIIQMAKDMNIKVIADFDDDILHVDQFNPMYETYIHQKPFAMECLVQADEIWVTTQGLKNALKLYNRNIYVIPNAHNDYLFPVKDKKPFNYNKKVAWRGGNSHLGDMYDNGIPEKVIEMVNNNPDWEFSFYGQRFEYLEKRCGDNYIAKGGASTIQFYKMMHDYNACVFFYPLADTVFNRSKSNIAWLEATYAGSAFFGNVNLPEFNQSGVLPLSEIEFLIKQDEVLGNSATESWGRICDEYLLSKVNQKRIERLTA